MFKAFSQAVEACLKRLVPNKPRGPHHDRFALFWILLLRYMLCFSSEKHLLRILKEMPWFARSLGLTRVPAQSVLTDFRSKIGSNGFQKIFKSLVSHFVESGGIVAADSSFFKAFANKYRKRKSDKDAAWYKRKSKTLFGFKLHLLIDAESEIPLAFCVTPANVHDSQIFRKLIARVKAEIALADTAYDSKENRDAALSSGTLPIFPHNKRRSKRRRKLNPLEQIVYNLRVSIERTFSRLKFQHALDALKMRGLEKASIHAALSVIALLVKKVIK
ncbi:MAG: transposase [Candidatus Micrarchaeota archaeon]